MASGSADSASRAKNQNKSGRAVTDAGRLLAEITCPNCWFRFGPEDLLFVSRSDSQIGDDIAGPSAYRRFLPMRFNSSCDALDAGGLPCQQLACPRCHLEISRPLIEMRPYFVSIVGAPSSGKSYLLATMMWKMRKQAARMGLTLLDGDPTANIALQGYEETLFMGRDADQPVALRKTEVQGGELYQTISLSGQRLTYPRPFQFTLGPGANWTDAPDLLYRSLVLYDNAGEHFLPGQDSTSSPVTLHLAESASILFLFDPTQDPRFRRHMRISVDDVDGAPTSRQEIIFNEMAARIRRYKSLGINMKCETPLTMVLPKADAWLEDGYLAEEPLNEQTRELDVSRIDEVSAHCREILSDSCPEIVAAAEAFASNIVYMPVSSLGTQPEKITRDGTTYFAVRPSQINPSWVTIPLWRSLANDIDGLLHSVNP